MAVATLVAPLSVLAAGSTAMQYEIKIELPASAVSPSWWSYLTSLIGIRTVTRLHPEIGTVLTVQASAYAPSPYQTDATPCITAAGTRAQKGVVATNFLPLGTILEINGERYSVEDRMNSRYAGYYLDVWLPSTSDALEFGRRKLQITIAGYGKAGENLIPTPDASSRPEGRSPSAKPSPQAEEKSRILDRVKNSVAAVSNGISSFIGTRALTNPNRYDIDCFSDTISDEQ